jgi:hypothetical protein
LYTGAQSPPFTESPGQEEPLNKKPRQGGFMYIGGGLLALILIIIILILIF